MDNETTGTSSYLTNSTTTGNYDYIQIVGDSHGDSSSISVHAQMKASGISPQLYFKYIKRKFGVIEKMKAEARLKRLEKAFNKAVENGQDALGTKLMNQMLIHARESLMYAKGIKHFIEKGDVDKFKHKIKGGHISDTMFKEFTRVIPKKVLDKKVKVESLFDDFVIFHYWNEKAEKVRAGKQKMTRAEKNAMRDPVLFGIIKETNRLYFIIDWDDDHCDLSFEEMIDVIGKDEKDITIPRNPEL